MLSSLKSRITPLLFAVSTCFVIQAMSMSQLSACEELDEDRATASKDPLISSQEIIPGLDDVIEGRYVQAIPKIKQALALKPVTHRKDHEYRLAMSYFYLSLDNEEYTTLAIDRFKSRFFDGINPDIASIFCLHHLAEKLPDQDDRKQGIYKYLV